MSSLDKCLVGYEYSRVHLFVLHGQGHRFQASVTYSAALPTLPDSTTSCTAQGGGRRQ